VQEWFPGVKVGHVGTLDPLAEGVLVIALGSATRLEPWVHDQPKTYEAGICLGGTSSTDDADGEITTLADPPVPTLLEVTEALRRFEGVQEQTPPLFSAAKLKGSRAYMLARQGRPVTLPPRLVRIDRIELVRYAFPELTIRVTCGKGTYIRALARDFGQALGCGAYVTKLVRTAVGTFVLADSLPWDCGPVLARQALLPLRQGVAHLPTWTAPNDLLRRLRHGQRLPWPAGVAGAGTIAVLDERGELQVLAILLPAERRVAPRLVLEPATG
jgi:tRNA pseudouridine55 synthase